MRIKYENTMDDLVKANLHYYATSPTLKRLLLRQRIALSVLLFGLEMIICSQMNVSLAISLPVSIALACLYYVRSPQDTKKRMTQHTEKLYREGENKGIIGPRELEVTEEGLISRTSFSESKYSWAMLDRIDSTPDYTYLYIGSASALILPHDAITEGDFRAFMAQIGQHYHPEKRLADKALL